MDGENSTDSSHNGGTAEAWARFVSRVRGVGPALSSVLEHGVLYEFGPMGVKVGYERDCFYWDSVSDPENRNLILGQLEEHFGQTVSFVVTELSDGQQDQPETLAQMLEHSESARNQQLREDAISHPAVQGAMAVLGGEVEDVVPLQR